MSHNKKFITLVLTLFGLVLPQPAGTEIQWYGLYKPRSLGVHRLPIFLVCVDLCSLLSTVPFVCHRSGSECKQVKLTNTETCTNNVTACRWHFKNESDFVNDLTALTANSNPM